MELYNKYRPTTPEEILGNDLAIKSIQKELEAGSHVFLFTGNGGCGKAQPLDSKVLTPNGFINMGDVKLGDVVFTAKGNLAHIVGIYPQGVRPIYKITLQDKTEIKVSDEHLNVVYRYNENKKMREDFVITTNELLELFETSRYKLRMDVPSVDFEKKELPIDPYLLGALLGDGSFSSDNFGFSNSEEDVVEKVDSILRRDWELYLKKIPGDNVD